MCPVMIMCLYRHCNDVVIQEQMTALHWAALSGHTNTVDALVKSGADVNLKDVVRALLMYY